MKFAIISFVKIVFFVTQITYTFCDNRECISSDDGKIGECVLPSNCVTTFYTNINKLKCKIDGNLRGVCCSKTNNSHSRTKKAISDNNKLRHSEHLNDELIIEKMTNNLTCIASDNEDGKCVFRQYCKLFNKPYRTKSDEKLLKKFKCKIKGKPKGVCCANKDIILGKLRKKYSNQNDNDNTHRPCKLLSTNENGKCKNLRDCSTVWPVHDKNTINIDERKKVCRDKRIRYYNQDNPIVCCTPPKTINTILLSLPLLLPTECGNFGKTNQKIIGENKENIPWLAWLKYEGSDDHKIRIGCMGSIIHESFILTSAHCLIHRPTFKFISVHLGTYDQPHETQIKELINHPDYNYFTKENDVGLIRLLKKITFTDLIKPICLPIFGNNGQYSLKKTSTLYANGWDNNGIDLDSYFVKTTKVNLITNFECNQQLRKYIKTKLSYSYMCTKGHCKNNTCYEKSGSALMQEIENEQGSVYYICAGIISFGPANNHYVTTSARTSEFVTWILQQLWLIQ